MARRSQIVPNQQMAVAVTRSKSTAKTVNLAKPRPNRDLVVDVDWYAAIRFSV